MASAQWQSMRRRQSIDPKSYVNLLRAYRQSIGQSCALGLDAVVVLLCGHWSREASLQCWGGESGWLTQALSEVEC